MMKIIGHRGAAGLALENSLSSLVTALASQVDAVEFDIWKTADDQFVLCHDADMKHMSGSSLVIADNCLSDLMKIKLHNGEQLVTLNDALNLINHKPVVMDVKGADWAAALTNRLTGLDQSNIIVISFNHPELVKFHTLCPNIQVYTIGGTKALQAIYYAGKYHLTGCDINYKTMNPLFYWYIRSQNLKLITYTINSVKIGKLFQKLYPGISITTDFPERFIG